MHTNFSHDSSSTPEEMVQGAIDHGLKMICFTDHYDKDDMEWGEEDIFDPEEYFRKMTAVQKQYEDRMDVRIGVELGLQPHLGEYYREFVKQYPFDLVIGSIHCAEGTDIARKKIFRGRTDEEVYRIVFREMLEDIRVFDGFDVFGHMDYVVRYGAEREAGYSYQKFSEEIDAVLRALIERGKGIELNMSGLKYGLPFAHPHMDILKRYRELGGEVITVGADGHRPDHIAYDYHLADEILTECGFQYYTEFKERKPRFCRI